MNFTINKQIAGFVLAAGVLMVSCKKDGNPNNLPDVSPDTYAGKIDGYTSSEEIYPNNLVAYWSFDDTKAEKFSSTAPTTSVGDSYVDGVRGKAISLNAGYLYYATQFQRLKTDSIKSWSISVWVKLKNNGSKRTMLFQLTRATPTATPAYQFTGNINFALNTNAFPATNDSMLTINPTFFTLGKGTQDNLNNVLNKVNLNNWVHLVLSYDGTTGVFNNWMNGVKVGNFPNRGTGNNVYKSEDPSEILIGANYNVAGKVTNSPTDVNFAAMTGQVDELRFYNISLPDANIKALYNLGVAKK